MIKGTIEHLRVLFASPVTTEAIEVLRVLVTVHVILSPYMVGVGLALARSTLLLLISQRCESMHGLGLDVLYGPLLQLLVILMLRAPIEHVSHLTLGDLVLLIDVGLLTLY